jgi:hypothetical protein
MDRNDDLLTEGILLDIAEELMEAVNTLMGSLIGWQLKPAIVNRSDKDKEVFNNLRDIIEPIQAMPKKYLWGLLQEQYAYWLFNISSKDGARLSGECPYTVEQFFDKNYFPPLIG